MMRLEIYIEGWEDSQTRNDLFEAVEQLREVLAHLVTRGHGVLVSIG